MRSGETHIRSTGSDASSSALRTMVPLILWTAFMLLVLLTPGDRVPTFGWDIPGADKAAHAVLFLLQALLLQRAWSADAATAVALRTLAVVVPFAAATELMQLLVPGRSADILDFLLDCAGAVMAIPLSHAWMAHRRRAASRRSAPSTSRHLQ